MMKRSAIALGVAVVALVIGGVVFFVTKPILPRDGGNNSSASSVSSASSAPSLPSINDTDFPLRLPDGFRIEVFADNLPGARVIVQDASGNFWVSRPSSGVVTQLEVGTGGTVVAQNNVFRNLRNPHGLAIDPHDGVTLYIAEEHRVIHAHLYSDDSRTETETTLPTGGRHTTRTLGFGPDDRLYISVGSTCDVCDEANEVHGTILSMNRGGSDRKIVARGLRNAVFFTWSYVTGKMFATEMGRDHLGDDLPPEEINIIQETQPSTSAEADSAAPSYGWPYCYGNQIRDLTYRPDVEFDCTQTVAPHITMPAHIAPLDLVFVPEEGWPEEYWYDLLVAQHGSWNSSDPVGYRIIRVPLDAQGNPEGEQEEFIGGWLQNGTSLGRPVGLLIQPGGTMFITDDKAGVVYKVSRTGEM